MPRPDKASVDVIYRDSVLDAEGESCPRDCIMRYQYDSNNWVDVTVGPEGIEIRSVGGRMQVTPISGNTIEVHLRERR